MAGNSCVDGFDDCLTCDTTVLQTSNVYRCSVCDDGHFATESNLDVKCVECGDEHCKTCSIAEVLGSCKACNAGYNLIYGTCEEPTNGESLSNNSTAGALVGSLRYDFEPADFVKVGGINRFIASLAKLLRIKPSQINVFNVRKGSTIVDFRIYALSSSTFTLAQLKTALDNAYNSGSLAFYEGVALLNYLSSVRANACPAGQYPDEGDCVSCSSDCPNCLSATECNKKNHVIGAVLGSVLGALAVILIGALAFVKKDYIKELMAGSPKSAQYGLAASSPTSPTVQNEAAHA